MDKIVVEQPNRQIKNSIPRTHSLVGFKSPLLDQEWSS